MMDEWTAMELLLGIARREGIALAELVDRMREAREEIERELSPRSTRETLL